MKKVRVIFILIALAGVAYWFVSTIIRGNASHESADQNAAPAERPSQVPKPEAAPPPPVTSSVTPGAPMTTTPPTPPPAPTPPKRPPDQEDPAVLEAESLALNIRHFGQRFGGNPVGTNAEIVKALTGGNQKGAVYLPGDLKRLNENGELIDRWGTPYFFHANSATEMEVRSAGPDKTLYTTDDVIQR